MACTQAVRQCEPVCQKLYCSSTAADDIYMCNEKCCWDNINYPLADQMIPLLGKDYSNDVSRSPDCDWDMFEGCRAQYLVDFSYYKRYACV